VAFFVPLTQVQLEKVPELKKALADFQFFANNVRDPLINSGVMFHELYAHSFRLRIRKQVTTFSPVKNIVGYYLVAPDKKPRIEYGVMNAADILETATEYFGIRAQ
jgi:hypothetical protein